MAVIICPSCGVKYRLSDSQVSEEGRIRCKKCSTVFRIQDNLEAAEPPQPAESAPDANALNFDFSEDGQFAQSSPLPEDEPSKSQEDLALDLNLDDMTLDFNDSSQAPAPELDFSFSAAVPEAPPEEDEEDIFEEDDSGEYGEEEDFFGGLGADNTGDDAADDQNLDISFDSYAPPEEEDAPADDLLEGQAEQEEAPEPHEAASEAQTMTLDGFSLGEDAPDSEVSEEAPAENEDVSAFESSLDQGLSDDYAQDYDEATHAEEEDLPTCCIDSLAMGLPRCEICGRNLEGKDQFLAQELQRRRRQELKSELIHSDSQVSFSEEYLEQEQDEGETAVSEDFTDVEQALDALADGTFQKTLQKQESRKSVVRTLKLVGIGIIVVIGVIAGVFWKLLPSSHEKLLSRYKELSAQQSPDVEALVALFLDAAIENDQQIFEQVSVMSAIPNITHAEVLGVGEIYGESSIGNPGRTQITLQEEIANLEKLRADKEEELRLYMAKNLSPTLIEESLADLRQRLKTLTAEFEAKEAESEQKLSELRQDLQETEQDLQEAEENIQKYMDAVDEQLKAVYLASVRNKESLAERRQKILALMAQEEKAHLRRLEEIKAEYTPQISSLHERITAEEERLEEAKLLEDQENSPVVVLPREIERLTQMIAEKKNALEEAEQNLQKALQFFTQQNEKKQIVSNQAQAEFVQVSRNVAVSIRAGGGSEQQVSVVLKQYQAILPERTLESSWLVEKIAK
ncbi:hypothetical protein GF339_13650 [candidate division KSB3 bacterium]|uniref:Zinc finger/thioredoxin putative domain-containing protein n=1 Tax=candidate division KSB3 bacterium TaxID=2044937 RepID=A0A9D5JWW4_9BACT|nr:hypothetical protein [candidate division KSB3 bacterium]MBD3325624.1 hypothetical protein [candidate division KSB3 bacterium]